MVAMWSLDLSNTMEKRLQWTREKKMHQHFLDSKCLVESDKEEDELAHQVFW